MNNILLLSIVSAILSVFILRITRKEIFSCSFMTISLIALGAFMLYVQSLVWRIDLHSKTLWILVCGMISMISGEMIAQKKHRTMCAIGSAQIDVYTIKYCNVLLLLYIAVTLLYALEIRKLGSMMGYDGLEAIGEVKANMEDLNSKMNPFIKQGYKFVTAASYIHSLIFANNVFLAKQPWRREIKHLLPFVCTVVITLASGGRLNIYKAIIGMVFILYSILRESSNWSKLYISKGIKMGLPLMIGFLILFNAASLFVKSGAAERDRVESFTYISYYTGSPITVFDIKANDRVHNWSYSRCGNYTFSGIYKILGTNRDSKAERIGNGMVYLGGNSDMAGNAQTIFGGSFFDFGLIGMCLFLFVTYFLFSQYYYRNIHNTYSSYKRNKRLLVYTYCYVSIIALAFYDNCYWILLSTNGLVTLAVLLFMYWIYFGNLLIKKCTL